MPRRCPNCSYELSGIGDEQSALCPECNTTVVLPACGRTSRPAAHPLALWLALALTPLIIIANETFTRNPAFFVGFGWALPLAGTLGYIGTGHLPRAPRIAAALVIGLVGGAITAGISSVIAAIVI
jgi:hypothetical protein